ncbi:MAG: NAD-dependent malic enzyme, partial [Lachnospiraceae bacterium]|nr:NAD-dependent malic enzyme [Lachnospiraceae bacterium]
MDAYEEALKLHEDLHGKVETISKTPISDAHALSVAYTPGVAEPCRKIAEDKELAYKYTIKSN